MNPVEDTPTASSGPPDVPPGLAFPGAVRLELDELLDQVIARASELKSVQGRLRKLLASTHHVSQRLDTAELHQRLVDSARGLVDARHATLGLLEGDRLAFVHTGLGDEQVATLAALSAGEGILAPLIAGARPLRLHSLTAPAGDLPPVEGSYLGVPVCVGDRVHGHLHLLGKQGADDFSRDDEELVATLAAAAGVAIENALLLEDARRRARWQSASATLSRRLLAGSLDAGTGLRHLLEEALELSDAQGATLSTVDDDAPSSVTIPCAAGSLGALEGGCFDLDDTITAAALASDEAIVLSAVSGDRRAGQLAAVAPAVGSALAVQMADGLAGDGTRAALTLVRDADRTPFGDGDVDLVEGLATQASATLAVARSRADREALRRLEDRELLVADLNTRVLQRLLRVGTALSGAASATDRATRDRVLAQVDELDDLVRELRRVVWKGPRPGNAVPSPEGPADEVPPARTP